MEFYVCVSVTLPESKTEAVVLQFQFQIISDFKMTKGKTLVTKGKTLGTEGKTLGTKEKKERMIGCVKVRVGRSPQLPAGPMDERPDRAV